MEPVDDSSLAYLNWRKHGAIVVGLLGFSVWLQIGLPTLRVDLGESAASGWFLVFDVLALGALLVGLSIRSKATILLVFPGLLIPGLVALPAPEIALLLDGLSALGIVTTTAMFIAVSSAWLSSDGVRSGIPDEGASESRPGRNYRRFVWSRVAPMLALLIVPLYGVLFDPAIVSTIAQSYPESAEVAQTFISLTVFFFWAILAYTQFLIPSLNLEYDRRKIRRDLRAMARGESSRRKWVRLSIEVGVVFLVVSSVWFLAT